MKGARTIKGRTKDRKPAGGMRDRKRVSLGYHCTRGGLERYIILKLVRVADIANWSGVGIAFFEVPGAPFKFPTRAAWTQRGERGI